MFINEKLLICPITRELFKDPVISNDGFTYERLAIEKWLINNKTDPLTRNTLNKTDLKSNITVKNIVNNGIKLNNNNYKLIILFLIFFTDGLLVNNINNIQYSYIIKFIILNLVKLLILLKNIFIISHIYL
jgi:hypothetical protein